MIFKRIWHIFLLSWFFVPTIASASHDSADALIKAKAEWQLHYVTGKHSYLLTGGESGLEFTSLIDQIISLRVDNPVCEGESITRFLKANEKLSVNVAKNEQISIDLKDYTLKQLRNLANSKRRFAWSTRYPGVKMFEADNFYELAMDDEENPYTAKQDECASNTVLTSSYQVNEKIIKDLYFQDDEDDLDFFCGLLLGLSNAKDDSSKFHFIEDFINRPQSKVTFLTGNNLVGVLSYFPDSFKGKVIKLIPRELLYNLTADNLIALLKPTNDCWKISILKPLPPEIFFNFTSSELVALLACIQGLSKIDALKLIPRELHYKLTTGD